MDQDSDIDGRFDQTSPPGDPDEAIGEAIDDDNGAHKIQNFSVRFGRDPVPLE